MRPHAFRHFLAGIEALNPSQIEDARAKLLEVRRRTAALAEIEARTERERNCPHCGSAERQRWGRSRTNVQRYCCKDCGRTYCGRTGSEIERIHHPHLFLEVVRDMLGDRDPLSLRKLARKLKVDKSTVWRWRLIIHKALDEQFMPALSGLVEADEAFQRESRKGSREWIRHYSDPLNWPAPPRHRWYEYGSNGLQIPRGLSRWQLPILTVVDRGGQRLFELIPDRKDLTIATALRPILSADVVLCSDGHKGYAKFATSANIDHYVVGSKSGTRMASATHHIQNVNSLHSRYSTFIGRFRGPASKYLPGYLRWFVSRVHGRSAVEVFRAI